MMKLQTALLAVLVLASAPAQARATVTAADCRKLEREIENEKSLIRQNESGPRRNPALWRQAEMMLRHYEASYRKGRCTEVLAAERAKMTPEQLRAERCPKIGEEYRALVCHYAVAFVGRDETALGPLRAEHQRLGCANALDETCKPTRPGR
jgi:hypothetical protein